MDIKQIVLDWFAKWESGDFQSLPLAEHFSHTSPFGTTSGKDNYLKLVEANRDKFLGYTFNIIDAIYADNKACIRYKAIQGDFSLDVSEWHYIDDGMIKEIVAYYHIGEVRDERKLNN